MGNGHNSIDSLILLNELQQFASPSTTAVGTTVPSGEDFQRKRTQNLANLVGSIGSPQGLSEEELLDIAMSTSPVGASIRGGKAIKMAANPIKGWMKKMFGGKKGKKLLDEGFSKQDLADLRKMDEKKALEKIQERNMLSKARMQLKQTQNKYEISDPDKQGVWDEITYLLDLFSKN